MTKIRSLLLIAIIMVISIVCISCNTKKSTIEEPNYNIIDDIESSYDDYSFNANIAHREKSESVISKEWPYQLDYNGTGTDMTPLPFGNLWIGYTK